LTLVVILGALVAIIGLAVLVLGVRSPADEPRRNAMMIGGTMAAAFGIVIAGFAIAYNSAAPLDLGTGPAR
jgi:hypothetical protein